MLAAFIFFIICFGIVASIGAALIVVVLMAAAFVGIVALLLRVLALIIQGITGKRPTWMLGKAGFVVGIIAGLIFMAFWYTTPTTSIQIPSEDCASIGVSYVGYGSPERNIVHQEQIGEVISLLENYPLKRRINLQFLNEGMVDGNDGTFLTFCDSDGNVIRKVRITNEYIGIAKKDKGALTVYTYYRRDKEADPLPLSDVFQREWTITAREKNGALLETFAESWQWENGTFSFYIPEWDAESWNIFISGTAPNDDGRTWVETKTVQYLEDNYKNSDWPTGETVSFPLEEVPHMTLTCTLYLDGAAFEYDLLPFLDGEYVYEE